MGQRCKVGPSVNKKINFIHHHKGQNHKGQNHFNRYRILFDKIQNPLMIKLKQASQEKNFLNKRSKKKPRVYLIITTTTKKCFISNNETFKAFLLKGGKTKLSAHVTSTQQCTGRT